jgi:putative flippase GtrA
MVSQMNHPQAAKLHSLLRQLLGYGAASTLALAVDSSILALLVKAAGWHYLAASVVAFICGGLVAYALSVRFVFRLHRVRSRSWELGCFLALGTAGLAVNTLVLSVAVGAAGLGLLAAKFCAAGCTFATNFVLRRNLLFAAGEAVGG